MIAQFERAIDLNPNFTDWRFSAVLAFAGHGERAVDTRAHLRVDPFAIADNLWPDLGLAYLMLRRHSER